MGRFAPRWPDEAALLRIAAALLLPQLALAAWMEVRLGSVDGLLAGVAARAWVAALLASLVAGSVIAARARRPVRSLAWAAALAAALSLTLAVGSGYSGVLELGEGEPPDRWTALEAGPFASVPVVEVVELPRAEAGAARLRVRGHGVEARPMEEVTVATDHLRVTRVAPAFAFELRQEGGEVLDGLLVKLHPGQANEFGFERLPHRVMAPLAQTSAISVPPPAELRLRVQRGKLSVTDRSVRPGEPLRFERLALRYGGVARWARIEVRGGRPALHAVGAGLALLAGVAAWLDRRRGGT